MASAFSHVIVATAVGKLVQPKGAPWWYWFAGAILSVLPDLDVIGFRFGIRYGDLLGHRGLSHSLPTAVLFAGVISLALLKQHVISVSRLFVFLFVAMASHGVLDAMTNGGLGVAFFSPFSNARYFFPFNPIEVSPIGVDRFFSQRGIAVISSEVKWLWLPSAVLVALAILVRRLKGSNAA
jgi:inner membrane protein